MSLARRAPRSGHILSHSATFCFIAPLRQIRFDAQRGVALHCRCIAVTRAGALPEASQQEVRDFACQRARAAGHFAQGLGGRGPACGGR
eukprot:12394328-Alexandrium_andersonii.AAC.1